jgi:hypothetical protein
MKSGCHLLRVAYEVGDSVYVISVCHVSETLEANS